MVVKPFDVESADPFKSHNEIKRTFYSKNSLGKMPVRKRIQAES